MDGEALNPITANIQFYAEQMRGILYSSGTSMSSILSNDFLTSSNYIYYENHHLVILKIDRSNMMVTLSKDPPVLKFYTTPCVMKKREDALSSACSDSSSIAKTKMILIG